MLLETMESRCMGVALATGIGQIENGALFPGSLQCTDANSGANCVFEKIFPLRHAQTLAIALAFSRFRDSGYPRNKQAGDVDIITRSWPRIIRQRPQTWAYHLPEGGSPDLPYANLVSKVLPGPYVRTSDFKDNSAHTGCSCCFLQCSHSSPSP